MFFSENKHQRPVKGEGLRQTRYDNPAGQLTRKVKIVAENLDGSMSRTFHDYKAAVDFVNKYLPLGYAVIRYYEPADDSWKAWKAYYSPWYKGKPLKLTDPRVYPATPKKGKKPKPMLGNYAESSATCFNIGNLRCY